MKLVEKARRIHLLFITFLESWKEIEERGRDGGGGGPEHPIYKEIGRGGGGGRG